VSNPTDITLTNKWVSEAEVYVSVVAVRGNPITTVKIVPKGGDGVVTISCDSAVTVQGAAMAGLLDTLKRLPWKDTT
jgi:hypothetical protein